MGERERVWERGKECGREGERERVWERGRERETEIEEEGGSRQRDEE